MAQLRFIYYSKSKSRLNNPEFDHSILLDFKIGLYDYRNESEPMLWFEDLHDGWPKPSSGFTWCPSMLDCSLTLPDITTQS